MNVRTAVRRMIGGVVPEDQREMFGVERFSRVIGVVDRE